MTSFSHKLLHKLRVTFAPNDRDRQFARWRADAGDETLRMEYPLSRESLVLDLGGYRGQWASDLYARYGCRLEVFEPVPSFAEAIAARFRHNEDIRVHAFGLAGRTQTEQITVCEDGSSTFRSGAQQQSIELVDIATWFAEHPHDHVDLMKVNIEGGEFELLMRMIEADLMDRVTHFQIQFHNFVPDAAVRMDSILAALSKTHEPCYQYRFVWEGWSRRAASAKQAA